MKRVVFAGGTVNDHCLEASYKRAFESLGFEVHWFDTVGAQQKHVRFGRLGAYLNDSVGVSPWIKKMQREFVLYAKSLQPDLILVFCNARIHYAALAFLKSTSRSKIALIWPDALLNLEAHVAQCARLYDGIATYSANSTSVFEALGFSNVRWIPLAADEQLHGCADVAASFAFDLCFIGNFRPERERDLSQIARRFPRIKMGIWGSGWRKRSHPVLGRYIAEKQLVGRDFAHTMNVSRISLNVIDDTNYPAANMRFFETPITHSLQLASVCPEWERTYLDMKHVAYYRSEAELFEKIDRILSNEPLNLEIRREGYNFTKTHHTYHHRARSIVDSFL
jgi:hypothetical protein